MIRCSKVLLRTTIENNIPLVKKHVCNKQLKKIGFHKDIKGVFRFACEEHWKI